MANKISFGNLPIDKAFFGSLEVKKMYLGNTQIYKADYLWSCVVAGLGSEDPTDVTFTHYGTMPTFPEVVRGNVGRFIQIPKMYRKVLSVVDNQIISFEIANYKKDNDFVPYPCFVKEDGTTEMDYILIGKYFNSSSNSINSIGTTGGLSYTLEVGRTRARALGSGYQLYDWQMHKLWQDLIICKKQTIDTNNGSGIGTDGYDDFGIYWSNISCWIDGILSYSGQWCFSYKPSEYTSLNSVTDSRPSNYIMSNYSRVAASGEIRKLGYSSGKNQFLNYPMSVVTNTNYNTYYCDQFIYGNDKRPIYCFIGSSIKNVGAFYIVASSNWSSTSGLRLCYRPI